MNVDELFPANEQPLDRIPDDGGFCGIFRTVACIGDSLSSGEFESRDENGKPGYHDMFEYSWGQYLARTCGSKVYNFSKGGMTAKEYVTKFAEEKGFWDPEKACQAYIIALGVNDRNQPISLGTAEDAVAPVAPDTFMGYYGQIVQRYKAIQPRAKFFFVIPPREPMRAEEKRARDAEQIALLRRLPDLFDNAYLIDLNRYGPVYDAAFREKFYLYGHLNPLGYMLTAKMIMAYIDYIIRHNIDDFRRVPYIGSELR